jgi:hypothetical protein
MFDPTIGRWLGEDPEGFDANDPNFYRYVKNSSTNANDPSGLADPNTIDLTTPPPLPPWATGLKVTDGKAIEEYYKSLSPRPDLNDLLNPTKPPPPLLRSVWYYKGLGNSDDTGWQKGDLGTRAGTSFIWNAGNPWAVAKKSETGVERKPEGEMHLALHINKADNTYLVEVTYDPWLNPDWEKKEFWKEKDPSVANHHSSPRNWPASYGWAESIHNGSVIVNRIISHPDVKDETLDIPEARYVKHGSETVLTVTWKFSGSIKSCGDLPERTVVFYAKGGNESWVAGWKITDTQWEGSKLLSCTGWVRLAEQGRRDVK